MATIRQKKAFDKLAENGGIVSKAMLAAGYSEISSKTPKKLTDSEGWKELMDKHLGDTKLSKKHDQLLNAVSLERMNFSENDTDEDVEKVVAKMEGYKLLKIVNIYNSEKTEITGKYAYVKAPDNMTQEKALDKAYKLKGYYAPEKSQNVNVNIEVDAQDPKALALAKEYEEKIKAGL